MTGDVGDAAAGVLTHLVERLERSLGNAAIIERQHSPGEGVTITPRRETALSVGWMDFGDQIFLQTRGGQGGRWELGRTEDDVAFLGAVVASVVDGRVVEVFGPSRSRVTVTLVDGTAYSERGAVAPVGCLPMPLWTRWGRKVHYESYVGGTSS